MLGVTGIFGFESYEDHGLVASCALQAASLFGASLNTYSAG